MVALTVLGWGRGSDRRVVRPCAAVGEVTEGDRSADLGGFGPDASVEVFAAQAVAVAFERHQGNATLNYRSVLARELTAEDAEIYRRPGHRRRLRRVSAAGEGLESV
jgi:hypothetical protein